jgi:hypothetical protein
VAEVDAIFTPYLPQQLLDARTSGQRGPFASDEGVEQLFHDAGLVDVRTVHRLVEAAFRDAEHLVEFSWSHGQRVMWESVPEREHPSLRERMLEMARGFGDSAAATGAIKRIADQLGIHPEALRTWVTINDVRAAGRAAASSRSGVARTSPSGAVNSANTHTLTVPSGPMATWPSSQAPRSDIVESSAPGWMLASPAGVVLGLLVV